MKNKKIKIKDAKKKIPVSESDTKELPESETLDTASEMEEIMGEATDASVTESATAEKDIEEHEESEIAAEGVADKQAESAENASDNENSPSRKKRSSFKEKCSDIMEFFRRIFTNEKFLAFKAKLFTIKTLKIAFLLLKFAILALCIVQVVVWGNKLVEPVRGLVDDLKNVDFAGVDFLDALGVSNITQIVSLFVFVIFILVFIFQLVLEGFTIVESRDLRYGSISSFFSFFIVALFMKDILGENNILKSIKFGGLFWTVIALILVLAFLRLINRDFKRRIIPVLFATFAGISAIIMFKIGSYSYLIFNGQEFGKIGFIDFLTGGSYLREAIDSSSQSQLLLPLSVIVLFLTHILPFAMLALLQYSLLTLLAKTSKQYYHLKALKKVGSSIIFMAILDLIGSVWLRYSMKGFDLSYKNLIISIIFSILTIVFSVIPWKIYNKNNKRYIAKLEKSN